MSKPTNLVNQNSVAAGNEPQNDQVIKQDLLECYLVQSWAQVNKSAA